MRARGGYPSGVARVIGARADCNFAAPESREMPDAPFYHPILDVLRPFLPLSSRAGFRGDLGARAPGIPPTWGLPPNPSISLFFDWPMRRCF